MDKLESGNLLRREDKPQIYSKLPLDKQPVFGMKDRETNKVMAEVVPATDRETLQGFVVENTTSCSKSVAVISFGHAGQMKLVLGRHRRVRIGSRFADCRLMDKAELWRFHTQHGILDARSRADVLTGEQARQRPVQI